MKSGDARYDGGVPDRLDLKGVSDGLQCVPSMNDGRLSTLNFAGNTCVMLKWTDCPIVTREAPTSPGNPTDKHGGTRQT